MAHEAPVLIVAYVAHHLEKGAHRVRLFLDCPQPELTEILGTHPRVTLHQCDDAWWRARNNGARPPQHSPRQRVNLQYALDNTDAEWVLHVDVDEFIWSGRHITLGEVLAAQPDHVDYMMIRVYERFHKSEPNPDFIFDGLFRRAHPKGVAAQVDTIDGENARYFHQGMAGYPSGKSAFRIGRGLVADIHAPRPPNPARSSQAKGLQLLHFDGLTPTHWLEKRRRMLGQQPNVRAKARPSRRAQIDALDNLQNAAEGQALYRQLKILTQAQLHELIKFHLILPLPFDPRPAMAKHFPDFQPDLSIAGFDGFSITG